MKKVCRHITKRINIHIVEVPEEGERKRKSLCKEIKAENYQILGEIWKSIHMTLGSSQRGTTQRGFQQDTL